MKSNVMHSKPKSGGKMVTAQQAVFEMKHRVVLSLNKLADRDTHQIGVDELEKAAESLSPEMIAPFLSCIMDTDSEQKSAVRKECVRVMGTLARFHGSLLAPHLSKMVSSVVKRLKDTDSVVRDACVETSAVLAMSIVSFGGGGAFVALVRPLFEALGEQNRYVQAGAALCLARVIEETTEPPQALLSQMLARVVKLLKNQHFMAKPALIELIRSIIQAVGALEGNALSAAISSILEALKNNDWTTRKAASVALAGIAVSSGHLLCSYKKACIRSLESCRFDKVKPVRDSIIHAIQCWRALPGAGSPEPSEAGSSTKENLGGDYSDVTSAIDSGWRGASFRKAGSGSAASGISTISTQKRAPLSIKKPCISNVSNHQQVKSNDWHIEISLPKSRKMHLVENDCEESGRNCIQNSFETRAANSTELPDNNYEYDLMDDKPEFSSTSDLLSGSYKSKHVTAPHDCIEEGDSVNLKGRICRPAISEIEQECLKSKDRKSLDSTITDLSSQSTHGCCQHAANELASIKQQLREIETKQSDLLDLLQVFMANSTDSHSTLQLKVHYLEDAVDKIACAINQHQNCYSFGSSKFLKKNQAVSSSPRLSAQTPRPSVNTTSKQPTLLSIGNREIWGETAFARSRSNSIREGSEVWKDPTLNIVRNPLDKSIPNSSGRSVHRSVSSQQSDATDLLSASASLDSARLRNLESVVGLWKQVNELLNAGDVEAAYVEVLRTGDDHYLLELMGRTGPILDRLSRETSTEVLNIMVANVAVERFLDGSIPWLQQVVDLSTVYETSRFFGSRKAQTEFLLALQELATKFTDSMQRTMIIQLSKKLSQLWGEASCRKICPNRGSRGSKSCA